MTEISRLTTQETPANLWEAIRLFLGIPLDHGHPEPADGGENNSVEAGFVHAVPF